MMDLHLKVMDFYDEENRLITNEKAEPLVRLFKGLSKNLEILTREVCYLTQFFFYADQLIIFCHPVGT